MGIVAGRAVEAGCVERAIDLLRRVASLPHLGIGAPPLPVQLARCGDPALRQTRAEIEAAACDHQHVIVAHQRKILRPIGTIGGLEQHVEYEGSAGLQ
jgi:hypothetical protein